MSNSKILDDILEGMLSTYTLKEILTSLSRQCYEKASKVRETQEPKKARDWVKAANYLMGAVINVNITNVS